MRLAPNSTQRWSSREARRAPASAARAAARRAPSQKPKVPAAALSTERAAGVGSDDGARRAGLDIARTRASFARVRAMPQTRSKRAVVGARNGRPRRDDDTTIWAVFRFAGRARRHRQALLTGAWCPCRHHRPGSSQREFHPEDQSQGFLSKQMIIFNKMGLVRHRLRPWCQKT